MPGELGPQEMLLLISCTNEEDGKVRRLFHFYGERFWGVIVDETPSWISNLEGCLSLFISGWRVLWPRYLFFFKDSAIQIKGIILYQNTPMRCKINLIWGATNLTTELWDTINSGEFAWNNRNRNLMFSGRTYMCICAYVYKNRETVRTERDASLLVAYSA
jgi:hypothetical protein